MADEEECGRRRLLWWVWASPSSTFVQGRGDAGGVPSKLGPPPRPKK